MNEKNTELSVSEMLRVTSENTNAFFMQVADHIDKLEATIVELNTQIQNLKNEA